MQSWKCKCAVQVCMVSSLHGVRPGTRIGQHRTDAPEADMQCPRLPQFSCKGSRYDRPPNIAFSYCFVSFRLFSFLFRCAVQAEGLTPRESKYQISWSRKLMTAQVQWQPRCTGMMSLSHSSTVPLGWPHRSSRILVVHLLTLLYTYFLSSLQ